MPKIQRRVGKILNNNTMPTSSTTSTSISLLREAKDVNVHKWTYPHMETYRVQEEIIDRLFRSGSSKANIDDEIIFLKVSTLNLYYSTFMLATKQMADGIFNLNIDTRLKKGDISLVEEIANCTSRRNYSFATKYCACHQPDKYPIYDDIVGEYLARVISKGNLFGYSGAWSMVKEGMKKNYIHYKEIYDSFIQQYGLTSLSYREVDWYLWTANKCLKSHSLLLFTLI